MSEGNHNINEITKLKTEAGFEELFFRYYPSLKSYAMVFLFDETIADDIIQDVFLNLWNKRNNFTPSDNLASYLHKSVYNRCMNHIRHEKANLKFIRQKSTDQEIQQTYYGATDFGKYKGTGEEFRKALHSAIDGLPEQPRRTFILSRKFRLKNREIADFLNISIKAVEKNLTKALKILRDKLADMSE